MEFVPAPTREEAQARLARIDAQRPPRWPPLSVRRSVWKYVRGFYQADLERFDVTEEEEG